MMRLVTDEADLPPLFYDPADDIAVAESDWPAEVDMILSAMDVALNDGHDERRQAARRSHRSKADLRLYAHDPLAAPTELFTRDVSATGVGFITRERLPLGYNGLVRITLDDGQTVTAACSVYRCREAIGGWYEGALHFAKRQPTIA